MPELKANAIHRAAVYLIGAAPVVATVAPKGMVALLALIGLLALFLAVRSGALREVFPGWAALIAGAALAWMAYRGIATFDGNSTLKALGKVAVLVVFAFATVWLTRSLSENLRRAALNAMAIGGALSLLIVVIGVSLLPFGVLDQLVSNRADKASIFNTGLITMAILSPTIMLHLKRRLSVIYAVAFGIALLAVTFVIGASTATVALAAGGFVALIGLRTGQQTASLLGALCVAATLTFPLALPLVLDRLDVELVQREGAETVIKADNLMGSVGHRYFIWRFALDKAKERPLLGWGFDTSRSVPGGHTNIDFGKELMPLHPHNAVLQVWLELGIPGLFFLAAVIWLLFRPPHDRPAVIGAGLVRPLTLLMLFAVINATFGIWQSWWLATIALVLASLYLWEKREDQQ